jgi:hypothetical protein
LATVEARLEKLRPEVARRYRQCISWGLSALGIMVATILVAFLITKKSEPATGVDVIVGCLTALITLSRSWFLLFQLLPLNRERNLLNLERQRLIALS